MMQSISHAFRELEHAARDRMARDGAPALAIRAFLQNLRRWYDGESGHVSCHSLAPLGKIPAYAAVHRHRELGRANAGHAVLIKLNGGLGTSMGLDRTKSLIMARDGFTFLDLILKQVQHLRKNTGAPLPLLLMNSFSTDAETAAALRKRKPRFRNPDALPLSFCQHRVPKLDPRSGLPARHRTRPDDAWCPPGHADLYCALQTTGLLKKLLARGYNYAFVSNADNLGALLDFGIFGYLIRKNIPFLMEVTARTESDRKGGHLARSAATGRLILRESAQCPPTELADFQNIHKYAYFNTNNLWIDLRALADMLAAHQGLPMFPLLTNRKPITPSDVHSPPVVQLESAMGAAIANFESAAALVVPRSRFAPVKTTNDLLGIRSDAYEIAPDCRIALRKSRRGIPPDIRLDPRYYAMLADFEKRFPSGAPSLRHCQALNVEGDFTFAESVICEGKVLLSAPLNEPVVLPPRTRLK